MLLHETRLIPDRRWRVTGVMMLYAAVWLGGIGVPARAEDHPGDGDGHAGPPPALVRVGTVESRHLQARWDAIGQLQEIQRAVVAAEQPGRVMQMAVQEGDAITAGQTVLAKIDDIWAQLALDSAKAMLTQAQASVAEARAQLDQAQRDRKYLDDLLVSGSAKPKEVQDAHTTEKAEEARLQRAQADLMAAQAELNRRQKELERLTVIAPFDGTVVAKMTEVGQWVDQGDAVVEVISRGQIDAVIDVPEAMINNISVGGNVELFIEPMSLTVMGQVVAINPSGSSSARTFPVKVRLADQDGKLKPGMSVTAKVPMGQHVDVLTVPSDAVNQSASGAVVWVEMNGAAMPVAVEVLFSDGDRYAVRPIQTDGGPMGAPLAGQMRVVVEGAERLFPGRPLQIPDQPLEPLEQAGPG